MECGPTSAWYTCVLLFVVCGGAAFLTCVVLRMLLAIAIHGLIMLLNDTERIDCCTGCLAASFLVLAGAVLDVDPERTAIQV